MNKINWQGLIRTIQNSVSRHSSEILTGVGIAGMITTTVLAVKATPRAVTLLTQQKNQEQTDKLTLLDTIKTAWRCYVPAAVTGVLSVTCLIGATSVSERRNTALATAYSLSESALMEYRDQVVATVGETKERGIRDEVAKEKIRNNPLSENAIIVTGQGNTLCLDTISGQYFISDIDKIRKAENEINRRMRDDMWIPLNDFYDELGVTPIGVGDDLGWDIDKGYLDIYFSAQLAQDEKTPCIVLNYTVVPKYKVR